jgi:predicted ferric reductase
VFHLECAVQSTKDVTLLSISFMNPNVIALEFAKSGPFEEAYQEGQYIFLLCPAVSDHQWHPFTISSGLNFDVALVSSLTCA